MTTGQPVSVREAAKHFKVDPVTVRRWLRRGCPCVRQGQRGPGLGAHLDLAAAERWLAPWRGMAGPCAGLSVDEVLEEFADILLETVEKGGLEICADISRETSAAALLVVWRTGCRNFGRHYPCGESPQAIQTLMSFL